MRRSFLILIILTILLFSCTPVGRKGNYARSSSYSSSASSSSAVIETDDMGIASYYAHKFHGRTTASGEEYDMYDLTAAHPNLPFGTVVKVTNLENGKSVKVRINDRGPFVEGRIIDLSYKAAQKIDMIEKGLVEVSVEIIK